MDDDLNVPAALAVVHEHLRAGNSALADRSPPRTPSRATTSSRSVRCSTSWGWTLRASSGRTPATAGTATRWTRSSRPSSTPVRRHGCNATSPPPTRSGTASRSPGSSWRTPATGPAGPRCTPGHLTGT
ncbi:DALR domain-containing protein [Oerskovia sp. M15]